MRKISVILSVSILLLMSLSSAIQETEKLSTLESEMDTQANVSGPLHLVDPSVHYDTINALAYDGQGNLFFGGTLCGRANTEISVTVECEISSESGSESTISFAPGYVSVLDKSGERVESHLFHSGYGDRIDEIITLENGDLLVSGGFCWLSNDCYLQGGGMLLEAPGNNMDAFVFRMDSDGNVIWSRAFWSAGNDIIHSLDEGPNGEIYLLGSFCMDTTSSCRLNSAAANSPLSRGAADIFFTKLSSDGAINWVKTLGSSTNDHDMWGSYYALNQKGIVATSDGGVLIAGSVCHDATWLDSCSFRFNPQEVIEREDGFVAKYSANGSYQWHEQIGGSGFDSVQVTVELDDHRILVGGNHYSPNFTAGELVVTNPGGSDAWWAILNHTSQTWEGLWDSEDTAWTVVHSAAVGSNGEIVIAGSACWQVQPCELNIGGKTWQGSSYGIGWAMKVDTEGNGEWIRGVQSSTRGNTHINAVEINSHGDVALSMEVCASDENNADCYHSMAGQNLGPVNNASAIRVIISDYDRDGVSNSEDSCADGQEGWTSDASNDNDADGCNDITEDLDDDNDGWLDSEEIACSQSPIDASSMPTDTDGDEICNNLDNDDDDDGYLDVEDAFPYNSEEWVDNDMDGIGDNQDDDDDNDDWKDHQDDFPNEACAYIDSDGDGRPDSFVIPNCPTSLEEDVDDDGDGVDDTVDAWPLDPAMGLDTDGDGLPDKHKSGLTGSIAEDTDDDNDGYLDTEDDFPLDANRWLDTDGDGIDDSIDTDRDGDDWSDIDEENCGTDSMDSGDWPTDSDNDGICDAMDKQGITEVFSGGIGIAFALAFLLILGAIAYSRQESSLGELNPQIPPPPSLDEVMEVEVEDDSD